MDVPVLANQQELIYTTSVRTQDVVWKTYWEQWMIGTNGERVWEIHAVSTTCFILFSGVFLRDEASRMCDLKL